MLLLLLNSHILIHDYCCHPQCPPTSPTAVGITFFHFYCSSPSQGLAPKPALYNNKILPLADCSPNVMFSIISARACQTLYIFQMDFNNSYLRPISSILDRCARSMIPMVWRTCRICAFKNDTYFQRISTISLFHDL